MLNDKDFFSPAGDLASISVGGGSNPGQPSVHPDFNVSGSSGTEAAGNKGLEEFAGMTADPVSPGSFVQFADAPESPSADLGNQLAGGLGNSPKP